jgi:rare lipoprotein A
MSGLWIVAMAKHGHILRRKAPPKPKQIVASPFAYPARALLILPASMLLIASSGVFAASINSEAVAPQRSAQSNARPSQLSATSPRTLSQTPARAATPQVSREARTPVLRPQAEAAPKPIAPITPARAQASRTPAGAAPPNARPPALRPTTVTTPNTASTSAPVRHASVPVLGREGPAAAAAVAAAQRGARQIAITASEPELTSSVRPSDVARFQKIGAPYQVAGTWYVPAHEPDYDETGVASWYGNEFHGKPTANGEIFDMNVVSGAHPTLPIPSLVEVTNLANGRSVIVRVNDRGPFVGNRLIDMSSRGAELLGFRQQGHTNVRVRYVGPADIEPRVTANNLTQASNVASQQGTKPLGLAAIEPPLPRQQAALTTSQGAHEVGQDVFVQVGAFTVLENAQRLRDQTAAFGQVQISEAITPDGRALFRVVLGPVASRAEALAKVDEINNSGQAHARVMAALN